MFFLSVHLYGGKVMTRQLTNKPTLSEAEDMADDLSAFTDVSMVEVISAGKGVVYRRYN